MKDGKKCDRRVIKTKRAIRDAFIKMLALKDYKDITVKDIATAADVDRKTVYNYYCGVHEIRIEVENELVALLEHAVCELDFEKNIKNPMRLFEIMTDIINTNIDLYGFLTQIDPSSNVTRSITSVFQSKIDEALRLADLDIDDYGVCANFITSGMISVYRQWFNSDRKMPLEQLSRTVGTMVINGISSFSRINNKEVHD